MTARCVGALLGLGQLQNLSRGGPCAENVGVIGLRVLGNVFLSLEALKRVKTDSLKFGLQVLLHSEWNKPVHLVCLGLVGGSIGVKPFLCDAGGLVDRVLNLSKSALLHLF